MAVNESSLSSDSVDFFSLAVSNHVIVILTNNWMSTGSGLMTFSVLLLKRISLPQLMCASG